MPAYTLWITAGRAHKTSGSVILLFKGSNSMIIMLAIESHMSPKFHTGNMEVEGVGVGDPVDSYTLSGFFCDR